MKITDVKVHVMHAIRRNWVFVKILTDEGIYGWGEGTLERQENAVKESVFHLAHMVVDEDPTRIQYLWQKMYRHGFWRGGVVIGSALSAIDQALWDITGKVYGQPVYKLLGGTLRNRVKAYSHANDISTAHNLIEQGYSALKTSGWITTKPDFLDEEVPSALAEKISTMRNELGPNVQIMIDNHGRSRPSLAIKQISAVAQYNPTFFEEPTPPDSLDTLAVVRNAKPSIDLATGERLFFRWGYKDLLARNLVDIIQPDVCHCGGISEIMKISSMAEVESVLVAPHNPNGPVACAASVHVSAAMPNFMILETARDMPWHDSVQIKPLTITNGFFDIPTEPGLGIDLDESVIASRPYQHIEPNYSSWDSDDGTPKDV